MKRAIYLRGLILLGAALVGIGACTAPSSVYYDECDPTPLVPGGECVEQGDAGTDADASMEEPGLNPSQWPTPAVTCVDHRCVPEPSDTSAGQWPDTPLLVWIGPRNQMPESCPAEAPYMKYKRFDGLIAPPAQCDACTCESSTGSCAGLPATIEIRNGACNQSNAAVIPFDGPFGWDGACSNANAIPAGQLCNGVPCAQYVRASTLPAPTGESCTATIQKPNAIKTWDWETGAIACNVKEVDATCDPKEEHCVIELPEPWYNCVARDGVHSECPDNYNEMPPVVLYEDPPIDDRDCSECKCGAPTGSMCLGSLRVYSDGACSKELVNVGVSSMDEACATIIPPGSAIGSKTVKDLTYFAGTCGASGGEPVGSAAIDTANAVTFCCLKPSPPKRPVQ